MELKKTYYKVNMNQMSTATHAFTLLEMMIAVFVISIMIAIVTPQLMSAGQRAQVVACEQNQRMIRGSLDEYYLLNHTYPAGDTNQQLQALVSSQLLSAVPIDPDGGNFIINDTDPNNVVVSSSVDGELGNGT